jgi:hypothetical protein
MFSKHNATHVAMKQTPLNVVRKEPVRTARSAAESNHTQGSKRVLYEHHDELSTAVRYIKNKHDVVFAIPSVPRKGNLEYLEKTLTSMVQHGVQAEQIWIHDRGEHALEAYRRVPTNPHPVNIDYEVTRSDDPEVQMAAKDNSPRKHWRIQEAADFRWLLQYVLDHTDARYIGFNQDDGKWTRSLVLPSTPLTSLWSLGQLKDCHDPGGHCGLVSMVFQRETLRDFLEWMEPLWKEKPIDWTLNDFVKARGLRMPVQKIVRHLGTQSSFAEAPGTSFRPELSNGAPASGVKWKTESEKGNELFQDRLERLLPRKPFLSAKDVAEVTEEILTFDIPRPIVIEYASSAAWVGITSTRWTAMAKQTGQCPNCFLRHVTLPQIDGDEPADVLYNPTCPREAPSKQFPHQITIGSCGESQSGTGRGYFHEGRKQYDYDASFAAEGPFHISYAHLHLLPPTVAPLNSTADFVAHMLSARHRNFSETLSFVHSNCGGVRGKFVKRILDSGLVKVARYGHCWHNKDIEVEPDRKNWFYHDSEANRDGTKTLLVGQHPFAFALENTLSPHYITEKRYQALLAGSVPVVWENDDSLAHLPSKDAAVVVGPDTTPEDFVKRLSAHRSEWKTKGVSRYFVKTLFETTDYLPCRICEYVAHTKPNKSSQPTSEHPKLLVEDYHDQYSMTIGHRIQRLGRGGANVRNVVVRLLYQWDSMMKHVGVPYWLAAGTLLGEYCQEGFLTNDNDGDVAMLENNFRQLTADIGLLEQRISDGYQLIVRSGLHSNIIAAKFADVHSGFYIDVTVWQQDGDALIHTSANWCENCTNNVLRVARNDVFPLRRCMFESQQVNCPRDSMPMLKQWYNPPFFNCRRTRGKSNDRFDIVAFMHIGKNGGTSFRPLLTAALNKRYGSVTCECGRHFDWTVISKHQSQGKQVAPVVLLRDPTSRAVSHFYFARTLSWTQGMRIRTQTLSEYLEDPQSMLETRGVWQDGQAAVSWFSGTHIASWTGIKKSEVAAREILSLNATYIMELATRRLRETWWFGLLERMDDSLKLLSHRFDMEVGKMGHSNSNKHPRATAEERERLKKLMPLDVAFYEYAQRLFAWRLNPVGTVPEFQHAGARPSDYGEETCESTRFILSCPNHYYHWDLNGKNSEAWYQEETLLPRDLHFKST